MFSKPRTDAEMKRDKSKDATAAPSIVSVDMRVSGDLRTDGDVQVDGVVDGDIQSTTLTVGKTAEINGEVSADVIRVWGRINGRIRAKEVTVMDTAQVNGDVFHESLEVARGATIEGMVKRQPKEDGKPMAKMNLVVSDGHHGSLPASSSSAASGSAPAASAGSSAASGDRQITHAQAKGSRSGE
jgi:cytoskeletal protein CcmA (bactofilin family)